MRCGLLVLFTATLGVAGTAEAQRLGEPHPLDPTEALRVPTASDVTPVQMQIPCAAGSCWLMGSKYLEASHEPNFQMPRGLPFDASSGAPLAEGPRRLGIDMSSHWVSDQASLYAVGRTNVGDAVTFSRLEGGRLEELATLPFEPGCTSRMYADFDGETFVIVADCPGSDVWLRVAPSGELRSEVRSAPLGRPVRGLSCADGECLFIGMPTASIEGLRVDVTSGDVIGPPLSVATEAVAGDAEAWWVSEETLEGTILVRHPRDGAPVVSPTLLGDPPNEAARVLVRHLLLTPDGGLSALVCERLDTEVHARLHRIDPQSMSPLGPALELPAELCTTHGATGATGATGTRLHHYHSRGPTADAPRDARPELLTVDLIEGTVIARHHDFGERPARQDRAQVFTEGDGFLVVWYVRGQEMRQARRLDREARPVGPFFSIPNGVAPVGGHAALWVDEDGTLSRLDSEGVLVPVSYAGPEGCQLAWRRAAWSGSSYIVSCERRTLLVAIDERGEVMDVTPWEVPVERPTPREPPRTSVLAADADYRLLSHASAGRRLLVVDRSGATIVGPTWVDRRATTVDVALAGPSVWVARSYDYAAETSYLTLSHHFGEQESFFADEGFAPVTFFAASGGALHLGFVDGRPAARRVGNSGGEVSFSPVSIDGFDHERAIDFNGHEAMACHLDGVCALVGASLDLRSERYVPSVWARSLTYRPGGAACSDDEECASFCDEGHCWAEPAPPAPPVEPVADAGPRPDGGAEASDAGAGFEHASYGCALGGSRGRPSHAAWLLVLGLAFARRRRGR